MDPVSQIDAKAQKRLDELEQKAAPMQTVTMDGRKQIAYFVGRRELAIDESVVAVPFHKMILMLGQMMTAIIAPVFAGMNPATTSNKNDKQS